MRPMRCSLVVAASVVTSVVVEAGNCSIAAARYGLMDFPAISVDRSKSSEPLSFCAEYSGKKLVTVWMATEGLSRCEGSGG